MKNQELLDYVKQLNYNSFSEETPFGLYLSCDHYKEEFHNAVRLRLAELPIENQLPLIQLLKDNVQKINTRESVAEKEVESVLQRFGVDQNKLLHLCIEGGEKVESINVMPEQTNNLALKSNAITDQCNQLIFALIKPDSWLKSYSPLDFNREITEYRSNS